MNTAHQAPTSQKDLIDPSRAEAMWVALDEPQQVRSGDALPPFFHQLYFWDAQPPAALGRDGHPRVGGLIPDMGLPRHKRRMKGQPT